MACKHIPNQKKIPVIGNVGSGTDITKPMSAGADNYIVPRLDGREQVAALMAYVKKNPASKVVGLMAKTTGYGQGGMKDMQQIAALQGIKPAAIERFGVSDTDMTSKLNKMKAAGVDTIVV
jgi:branched-chain amino acid transport system substrate-binding protein